MVTSRMKSLGETFEETLAIVSDGRGFTVDDLTDFGDLAAERGVDTLEAHADSQDRDFASIMVNGRDRDPRVGEGMTRTGGDDEMGDVGMGLDELLKSARLRSDDRYGAAEKREILVEVPGEAIVVIDHQHPSLDIG